MHPVTYTCLDGSPFPVEFASVDDERSTWHLDREHAPVAMTPLADAVGVVGGPGQGRAYDDCGVTRLAALERTRPDAHGYEYVVAFEPGPEASERLGAELARLARQHGGAAGVWAHACLPAIRDDCAWLRDAPSGAAFATLADRRQHAWGLTGVAGLAARVDERAVAASCAAIAGDRITALVHRLAQGSDNETIGADRALARLARMDPGSVEAVAARAEVLAAFGDRATSWPIDSPTFAERPDLLDAQLQLLRRHGPSGQDVTDAAAARRTRLVDEVTAALPAGERERFHRRLTRLESFVPIREARARWQLIATGAMRAAVRRRGHDLSRQGLVDDPDDVFLLTPHEYDDPAGDLRSAITARRDELRHWRSVVPPATIGQPPDAVATGDDRPGARSGGRTLHGVAGAPGTVRGTARVIVDLDDVERLEPGDILVTTMTSPPWTPLFAIAAAVVTDAGDAISHVAIAAREYGIACVAGTHHATALVRDGTTITVDGDAGTVLLDGPPGRA